MCSFGILFLLKHYHYLEGYLVCWAKNRRLVLNEVKPNVYRECICEFVLLIDPIHVYPALVDVIMIVCWASLRCAPTGKKHATAPEFQPPACCAFPAVWLWSGTWLLRQEGICWPCYRTELVREGGVGDFSGKINKFSCHGGGRWGISAPLLAQRSLRIWTGNELGALLC